MFSQDYQPHLGRSLEHAALGSCIFSGVKKCGGKVQACLLFILFKLIFDLVSALPSASRASPYLLLTSPTVIVASIRQARIHRETGRVKQW